MAYYWAGKQRIPLAATRLVAVDVPAAERAKLWSGDVTGEPVTGGIVLVPAAALTPQLIERLRKAGAAHPVLEHDDTLLVVLPEVRVDTGGAGTAATVRAAAAAYEGDVDVEQTRPGQLVLRPASGRGEDALDLANYVYEHAGPAAAQARFLRITPGDGR
ncbi:hypothetical protein [Paractinoplanes durhamensis]|uniref:Uncharacterized protein n=1 Tax=Paractinoplanes durhamensis TaxID=113563 RepID=A0ABQ3YUV5_9ACTN|nr:hypothetical protein [Actinoplanes durhamensis]GIE01376.1 hypothetical protein Adu01nite_27260 [Actinoplanes durhamensis]